MTTPAAAITRLEIRPFIAIHCPFCGHEVKPLETFKLGEDPGEITPCAHTLFIASDHGYDHRAPLYNKLRGLDPDDDDIDLDEDNMDEFTDKLPLAGSIKIAQYAPAPSFMGTYYGFADQDLNGEEQ